jgi:hypothetical protein
LAHILHVLDNAQARVMLSIDRASTLILERKKLC